MLLLDDCQLGKYDAPGMFRVVWAEVQVLKPVKGRVTAHLRDEGAGVSGVPALFLFAPSPPPEPLLYRIQTLSGRLAHRTEATDAMMPQGRGSRDQR